MSENSYAIFESGSMRIRIERESYPESPLEWDQLGIPACWHERYSFIPKHLNKSYGVRIRSAEEMAEWIKEQRKAKIPHAVLGIQFRHGGDSLVAGTFDKDADDGALYINQLRYDELCGGKCMTRRKLWAVLRDILKCEFDAIRAWAEGDVYGFVRERRVPEAGCCPTCERDSTWEHLDSCWGFYDTDNDMSSVYSVMSENWDQDSDDMKAIMQMMRVPVKSGAI